MSTSFSGRVTVTGASSFVGCHLAAAFAAAGNDVTAIHFRAADEYEPLRRARLDHAASKSRLYQLDLRDHEAAARYVATAKPDLWIHHIGYTENYTRPDFDWIDALETTARPLAALYPAFADIGTRVIVTGTDQEYGAGDRPNREDDPCQPIAPYGLSKLAETLAARQLAAAHQVPTRIARVYIPFGPLDNPQKLLPQVIEALRAGRSISLSAGTQERDFIGVGDVCEGYLALARDMDRTLIDIFNISSGVPTSVRRLLETVCDVMNADRSLLKFGERPMRSVEPPLSCGANDKARDLLHWQPRALAEAIAADLIAD